jgi:hypothetical protein
MAKTFTIDAVERGRYFALPTILCTRRQHFPLFRACAVR